VVAVVDVVVQVIINSLHHLADLQEELVIKVHLVQLVMH
jgi:hypothetical protein